MTHWKRLSPGPKRSGCAARQVSGGAAPVACGDSPEVFLTKRESGTGEVWVPFFLMRRGGSEDVVSSLKYMDNNEIFLRDLGRSLKNPAGAQNGPDTFDIGRFEGMAASVGAEFQSVARRVCGAFTCQVIGRREGRARRERSGLA